MPDLTTALAFAAASFALIVIPGPNVAYIATRTVSQGRRAGIASALGVEAGALVHIGAAAAGLSALIAQSETAFEALRYAGAGYLLVLGIRTLRSGDAADDVPVAGDPRLGHAFAEGIVVNLLNPKVTIFFLAFLPQFLDRGDGSVATQTLLLGAIFIAIACVLDVGWALLADAFAVRLRAAARMRRRVTGVVYLVLGGFAAIAGGRNR